jgi:3-oxoacyl-[acyl-carrier protein] reductase
MIDLSGRHALVTGASKGIGRATAIALARAGAEVTVHFGRDEAGAVSTLAEIRALGRRAAAVGADLSRWDAGPQVVAEAVGALGPLDVIVVNHGIWKGAAIDEMRERDYDEMLDVNLRGTFALVGAAARHLRGRPRGRHGVRGRIVLVSSTAGQRGEAGHAHYAATKGAVISLTKSLSSELGPEGVLVNCVAPGWVDTPMSAPALGDPSARARVLGTIPLGRVADADEIAGPIAFLASDLASFVSGEILNVNGGAVLCG